MASSVMRKVGTLLLGVAGLVVLAAVVMYGLSEQALAARTEVTPAAVAVPGDSAALGRGQHLVEAVLGCRDCHGPDFGGTAMPMGPVGTFTASNLTTGQGSRRPGSGADWVRALRHGVRADGTPLVFMSSAAYTYLSDEDLGAVVAYVESRPPVDNTLPPLSVGPIGRVILATKPQQLLAARVVDHAAVRPARVAPGRTLEYGEYLARIGGCAECHGPALRGGLQSGPPGTPPSADLATGPSRAWSEAEFRAALQEGRRPDGSIINPFMPYRTYARMTEEEVEAVFDYVRAR